LIVKPYEIIDKFYMTILFATEHKLTAVGKLLDYLFFFADLILFHFSILSDFDHLKVI